MHCLLLTLIASYYLESHLHFDNRSTKLASSVDSTSHKHQNQEQCTLLERASIMLAKVVDIFTKKSGSFYETKVTAAYVNYLLWAYCIQLYRYKKQKKNDLLY